MDSQVAQDLMCCLYLVIPALGTNHLEDALCPLSPQEAGKSGTE